MSSTGEWIVTPTSSQGTDSHGLHWCVDSKRGRPEVVVEVSIPRWVRGDNRLPSPAAEVHATVERIYVQIGQQVDWICGPGDLSVQRIDIARGFLGGEGINSQLLVGLAAVPSSRATTSAYSDRSGNLLCNMQTLERITGRWRTRLYDRAVHYAAAAAHRPLPERAGLEELAVSEVGKLRYEVELRSKALIGFNIRVVSQIQDDMLEQLSRKFFLRSRFDARTGGESSNLANAIEQLRQRKELKMLEPLLGSLLSEGYGLPTAADPRTRSKYLDLAQTLGLTPDDVRSAPATPLRLCWESGRVLVGSEALSCQ